MRNGRRVVKEWFVLSIAPTRIYASAALVALIALIAFPGSTDYLAGSFQAGNVAPW